MNKYLIINAGSSSLKFSIYKMPDEIEIVNGYIEKIGKNDSFYTIKYNDKKIKKDKLINNHKEAIEIMIKELIDNSIINSIDEIKGIGHRVLHGGEYYKDSVIIDEDVIKKITELIKLGPLHQKPQIELIKEMCKIFKNILQVAVFDTAFHQTIPEHNYLYAVPYKWYLENKVRKYGFHGTSHKYITIEMKKELNKDNPNLIICHVGSGASISCIRDGKCYDTTMGLTPLDGLIMGTRSGSIDASIIKYIMDELEISINDIDNILNKESGLMGICNKNDFRDVCELKNKNDKFANLAYNMLVNSIIKYIAQYYFELDGKIDAIVFTAGILENNASIREDIINKLSNIMNVYISDDNNKSILIKKRGIITTNNSKFKIYVIPTNEELMIARDTYKLIN